ncbi:MAG TPA: site-specific integrase, partial [Caulobacteraceae bacterium]
MMAAERGASAHTLVAYGKDIADLSGFLAGRDLSLEAASPEDIEAWFASLSERGLAGSTAARRRAAVRQFYRFVLGEGWRPDDPSRRVAAPRLGRPLPKVLSREEMERLIAAAAADGALAAAEPLPEWGVRRVEDRVPALVPGQQVAVGG